MLAIGIHRNRDSGFAAAPGARTMVMRLILPLGNDFSDRIYAHEIRDLKPGRAC